MIMLRRSPYNKDITARVKRIAEYYTTVEGATLRKAAAEFGVCKTTVHLDLTVRLPQLNKTLYRRVRKIMAENAILAHIHGGEATRLIYEREKRLNEQRKIELQRREELIAQRKATRAANAYKKNMLPQ